MHNNRARALLFFGLAGAFGCSGPAGPGGPTPSAAQAQGAGAAGGGSGVAQLMKERSLSEADVVAALKT